MTREARLRLCAVITPSIRLPVVVQMTGPPTIPAFADASSANANTMFLTAVSTFVLQTASGDDPAGVKKDTEAVNTTVVGGTAEKDGLVDGVTVADALPDNVSVGDTDTDTLSDAVALELRLSSRRRRSISVAGLR